MSLHLEKCIFIGRVFRRWNRRAWGGQPTREGDIRKIFIDLRAEKINAPSGNRQSYDDLSARFNGVSSIAVTTLDVEPKVTSMYSLSELRASMRVHTRAREFMTFPIFLLPFSQSLLSQVNSRSARRKYRFLREIFFTMISISQSKAFFHLFWNDTFALTKWGINIFSFFFFVALQRAIHTKRLKRWCWTEILQQYYRTWRG